MMSSSRSRSASTADRLRRVSMTCRPTTSRASSCSAGRPRRHATEPMPRAASFTWSRAVRSSPQTPLGSDRLRSSKAAPRAMLATIRQTSEAVPLRLTGAPAPGQPRRSASASSVPFAPGARSTPIARFAPPRGSTPVFASPSRRHRDSFSPPTVVRWWTAARSRTMTIGATPRGLRRPSVPSPRWPSVERRGHDDGPRRTSGDHLECATVPRSRRQARLARPARRGVEESYVSVRESRVGYRPRGARGTGPDPAAAGPVHAPAGANRLAASRCPLVGLFRRDRDHAP